MCDAQCDESFPPCVEKGYSATQSAATCAAASADKGCSILSSVAATRNEKLVPARAPLPARLICTCPQIYLGLPSSCYDRRAGTSSCMQQSETLCSETAGEESGRL